LPRNLNNLKRLQDLVATGNPNLAGPPQWVVAQGISGIRSFYDALSKAELSLSLELSNQASCLTVPPELFHMSSLTALTIFGCPIDSIHDDVGMMLSLTALEVSHCKLKKLPGMLSKCLNMTSLNLQKNELSALPIRWAELTNLQNLSLAQNKFELMPPCIQYFILLSWFDMCDNFLASIPSWYDIPSCCFNAPHTHATWVIFFLCRLVMLPYLDCFEMGNNTFRLVPALVFELGDRQMISLNLSGNGIETLPAAIATQSGLTSLRITHNKIGFIPAQVCSLFFLEILNLSKNELTLLPAKMGDLTGLKELQLHCNHIIQLPLSLKSCTKMNLLTLHENRLRFFPLFVSEWRELQELWVPDIKQLPPFLINSTPAVIYTSEDENTVRGEAAILRKAADNAAKAFVNLVSQSKSKSRWQKVSRTIDHVAQDSLNEKKIRLDKLKEERIYFDSDAIVLYQHSLTTGIRLQLQCEIFMDTTPRALIFKQVLDLASSDGGHVMTKEVGIMPLHLVTGHASTIILVVELRKTGTNELLGIGETFIDILELRGLQGNDFERKNVRLLGGHPMATVADTNMCIRIQMKDVAKIEEAEEDGWNPDDFD